MSKQEETWRDVLAAIDCYLEDSNTSNLRGALQAIKSYIVWQPIPTHVSEKQPTITQKLAPETEKLDT